MHLMLGNVLGRHLSSGSCSLGRYSWSTFRGRNDNVLCCITGYRVCQSGYSDNRANNTSHWQQVKGLVQRGYERPNPRKQILTDLSKIIQQHQNQDHDIILMMDANEAMTSKSAWSQFLVENNLHNVHDNIMSSLPPTTRIGSSDRIDFIAASEGVLKHVTDAGYGALHDGIISDHLLLWIDLDMQSYFGGKGPAIVPPQAREFSFDNVQMREKFITELKIIHEHQRIEHRIRSLEMSFRIHGPNPELIRQFNALDYEIICSIKAAANRTVK